MAKLPNRNPIFRVFWAFDSLVSSSVFETWDALKRWGSAYSSFVYRFKVTGPRRFLVDVIDDCATFGMVFAFSLLAFALPPFSGLGDVWNKNREFAITFTDANGEIIGQRGIRQDDAIPLEEMPPTLIKAVLATEDARFFDHFGVDVIGTLRAIIQNARANSVVQGGSSLTQQVAKNLFLSPERTIQRKVHEAFLSLWIEARKSKQEILKLYLDRSYLGGGNYGVEAAAQFYFGKSIRDVNLSEAAMLAGLFKAPTKYAPHQNMEVAKARANVVLYRMLDAGFITQGELLQARRQAPPVIAQRNLDSPDWFLDWAYEQTIALLEEQHLLSDFVIEVKTTVDVKLQAAAQKILNDVIDTEGPGYHFAQMASVTMTPEGAVKAIVGGRNYENSQFNRATNAERQTGSAFKPFVYLAALLAGYTPDRMVVDAPISVGGWSPGNYSGKYGGRVTMTTALAKSYNSVPVRLMVDIGRPAIIKTTHAVGVQGELETWPPMVLGTSALTLMDVTTGYATFAGGGKLAEPYTILEIRRPNGDVIYDRAKFAKPQKQVVPEEKIAELNSMLKEVVKHGTARKADLGFAPQGGKTGTNQAYRDAWYVGFTAHNVTGVWVGNDDFTPMRQVTGGLIPAPAWKRIMEVAEAGEKPTSLAGIPLDDTYAVAATEQAPDGALVPDDETGIITIDTGSSPTNAEGVAVVLNDMFSLFEKKKPAKKAAKPKDTKVAKSQDETLVLPGANANVDSESSFMQDLFIPIEPEKKKKKKKKSILKKLNPFD
ncbi:MAG: PBP1A family penicillin-binding protein [Aestuariivirga sp.]